MEIGARHVPESRYFTAPAMSDTPPEFDLKFLPDWLKESAPTQKYADYEGPSTRERSFGERGDRPGRRPGGPGGPRPGGPGGGRPGGRSGPGGPGERRGPRPGGPGGTRGDRPGGDRGPRRDE